ncbi:unnamed protein product [Chrysoparadoxa australica]
MNMLNALGQGGMGMADMAWNVKCREEDMLFRQAEIARRDDELMWREIDDARRAVDKKAKQLEQVNSGIP